MADSSFIKGFRTSGCYFVENTFGTFNITNTQARRVGGKLKGVNWTVRQNILQTGNLGDGRNFKQQLFGQYDASASLTYEIVDFSFLRFAVGDLGKFNAGGTTEAAPYFLVEGELSGTDGTTTSSALLNGNSSIAYTNVRIRPFSMMLYDMENAADGSTWNDNVDQLSGCMISDFTISSAINSPVMCNVNMVVREISYRRSLESASKLPSFTSATTSALDIGNADYAITTAPAYGTPAGTQSIANSAPLMFYGGALKIANASTDFASMNVLGQVTSFNYSYNNNLITYRTIGSRFIELPQLGMRRQTLSCNVVFRLPSGDATYLQQGLPTANVTSILELIRNYLGYNSTSTTTDGGTPFTTADTMRPAMATTSGTTSAQSSVPIEKYTIQLYLSGSDMNVTGSTTNVRGATVNVRYAAIEGFGVPLQLENGLIEIPINFSVRGMPYVKTSDGSYGGHTDGATTTFAGIAPILTWWL